MGCLLGHELGECIFVAPAAPGLDKLWDAADEQESGGSCRNFHYARFDGLCIGVGGILLYNYSACKSAETSKTLALLARDRIDLGIGQSTSGALQDLALQPVRTHRPVHDQAEK